jgi:phosphoribosylpyrophosphate synthetase
MGAAAPGAVAAVRSATAAIVSTDAPFGASACRSPPIGASGAARLLAEAARDCKNVRQLSVAFLFAETIRRISDGESVTSLFSEQNNNF